MKMRKIHYLKLVILWLFISLSGCGMPVLPVYVIDDSVSDDRLEPKTTVIFEDVRPESDKSTSIGSLIATSDNYAIWTLGDKQFKPTVIELLKNRVIQASSTRKRQPKLVKIKLRRLKIQSDHKAAAYGSVKSRTYYPANLGELIGEILANKLIDIDIDLSDTRPFVIAYINAEVELQYNKQKTTTKNISLVKYEYFHNYRNNEERKKAAELVVKGVTSGFAESIYR
jgi:hypothetical protein